mgnify:CR=1 FL=1
MIIQFHTRNLDFKLYQKMILNYIYDHYRFDDFKRLQIQDNWNLQIYSTEKFDFEFYGQYRRKELSNGIPHGVTGQGEITCYVIDSKNDLIRIQNMTMICHELAHMILKVYYPERLVRQRHDDFYHVKNTTRQFFSSEVHDRTQESKFRQFETWHKVKKFKFLGVDISDITNSRGENKIGFEKEILD